MLTRRLGRTENQSSVVIFGTAAFWDIEQEEASAALDLAERAGVNHIDVAPQYGKAQERLGPWLEARRDRYFISCKTLERERDAAWAQLHESLELIRTDHFDVHQLHAVTTMAELDAAFAKGGAMEALIRARDEGLTRFLGITGHGLEVTQVQMEALRRYDFDTIMFPINPVLYANEKYREEATELLEMCEKRDVGVMIIKSVAKGPWADPENKDYNTWYEPYDVQEKIDQGVRFALSQSPVTGIASAGDTRILPMVIDAAQRYRELSAEEQAALIAQAKTLEPLFT